MRVSYERAQDAFVHLDKSCQLPTISPAYVRIDAQRSDDLEPVFWLYEEKEKVLYQGAHISRIPATIYRDMQTPYQYGGPICNTNDAGFLLRAWNTYKSWCQENYVVVEFVRFHPLLQNWDVYPGGGNLDRMTVWIDLADRDLMSSYQTRVRTAVRKAIKHGLRVEWRAGSESAEWFAEFYYSAMRDIAAEQFYFFPTNYFHQLLAWKQCRIAVCMDGSEPVAASVFLIGPDVTEYHLSASSTAGKRLGATNLILHEAAKMGRSLGCRALYLGGGTDNKPDNPLLFFKAGFCEERAEFRIGKYVHSDEGYSALKAQFSESFAAKQNRVLFYR
jgi:hypothetical protein